MFLTPVSMAVSVLLGIIAALNINLNAQITAMSLIFVLWIVASIIKHEINIAIPVLIIGFAAGSFVASWTVSESNNTVLTYVGRYVTLEGVILSQGRESNTSDNYQYPLRVTAIDKNGEISEVNETVLLTSPVKINCGKSISAKGIIKDLPGIMNENGMDLEKYYRSQDIFTRIYTEDISEIDDIKIFSLKLIQGKLSEKIDNIIYKYYTGDTAAVLSAILTGNTHHFSEEYDKLLDATAFKRVFHPAYIHIMIVTFLISLLSARVHVRIRNILTVLILVAMAVLSCGSIGFVRCSLTGACAILYKMKNGTVHTVDVIAWVALGFMLSSPLIIYNAGFVMSVTAGVIVSSFMPLVKKHFRFLPKLMRRTAAVMTVCTIIQLPLTAYYFDGICPYSVLFPFVMVPLVLVVLITAPVTFALYEICGKAPVIGAYLEASIWVMLKTPGFVNGLPFSEILMRKPSKTELAASAAIVFALYYYMKKKKNKAVYLFAIGAGLVVSSVIGFVRTIGTADFTFVNVGQGDGAVINVPMGARILIDGGGGNAYSEYDPGEKVFVPYLISKGYTDIDAAVLSHFHKDHAEGIIAAVEMLNVKNVFAPAPDEKWTDEMYEYKAELESAASVSGTEIHYVSENTRLVFDCGIVLDMYVPNDIVRISNDDNDMSLLIKAKYYNTSAIYSGDISSLAEKGFISGGIDVKADIMKVSHHGSAGSSCEEWISAVDPDYAVISCGEDNPYGHPSDKALERLEGIPIIRTDINGTITFTADKDGMIGVRVLK